MKNPGNGIAVPRGLYIIYYFAAFSASLKAP